MVSQWFEFDMSHGPPDGCEVRDDGMRSGARATESWLYMPLIMDAVGRPDLFPTAHRSRGWPVIVEILSYALARAGITTRAVLAEAGPDLHLSARWQEELIGLSMAAAG